MALKKKPVTGMKDMMPAEMEVRDYVIGLIKETYKTFGFSSMETPCVEHIENLCSKQGGDNEKLIFKILKRGEKLKLDTAKEEADLVDGGLRYDLTVPLSRYYANHANELPSPFKALQMGNVWRADRPQRGRFRQFMQCDIDILGEPSNLAEIELILATTALLGKLDFKNFTIRINDRRFLKAMAAYSGFKEEDYDSVFITLDKMDKIGLDGVAAELKGNGYAEESVEKYLSLFEEITNDVEGVRLCKEKLQGYLAPEPRTLFPLSVFSARIFKRPFAFTIAILSVFSLRTAIPAESYPLYSSFESPSKRIGAAGCSPMNPTIPHIVPHPPLMPVMIEGKVADENAYVGRTYRDAPNVDGLIFINTEEELISGDFAKVKITGALEYDLIGELL